MIRFYAPDIDTMQALPEAESAHAVRVLRKKPATNSKQSTAKATYTAVALSPIIQNRPL